MADGLVMMGRAAEALRAIAVGPALYHCAVVVSIALAEVALRACIQRASSARVLVDDAVVGEIGRGFVVLLGVAAGDTDADLAWMVDKVVDLRVFDDAAGKMNLALADVGGALLVVSQFTLLGDCRKGRRPSFVAAAGPETAERMYDQFVAAARAAGCTVATGRFRAAMQVELVNDGPVTILLDSAER